MTFSRFLLAAAALGAAVATATATVAVAPPFTTNMVLQRGKPVPVYGTAAANKSITVSFNSQNKTTTSDATGRWRVTLDTMAAKTAGGNLTATETGANTVTLGNVVVGDVWICGGQSNMAWGLSGCNRQVDIDGANYPGIRHLWVPLVTADNPQSAFSGNWSVCSPATAGGFSAVGFYFARKIHTDQGAAIPIGLIASTVGGTNIDPWLVQEGCTDIPTLSPLFGQSVLPWGPFSLANGMIHPLASFACMGAIWYQGENRETTNQSTDSYYLKEKALQQGWKRLFGLDDFALYVVQLANWLEPATATTPDAWGSWADTRQMQEMVANLAHGGVASALDVGEVEDIHPKDKLDVGERLALWALKNDYGRTTVVPCGPILKDVTVVSSTPTYPARKSIVCSFNHVGAGLMVGSKTPYLPTAEVVGGTLQRFVVAGATGSWVAADAVINGATVEVSSASVTNPTRVAYAYWMNPSGANLYNRDGLPASPFYVDDVTAKYTVTASAGTNGSISPAGATTYLKRRTALYTITPDSGYFIQDVLVDGVSVGAVKNFTFDPLYASHTISATFSLSNPTYLITPSANTGGGFSPAGPVTVAAGGSTTLDLVPNTGYRLISITMDGAPMGRRNSFTFADVRANHVISGFFAPIPTPGTGTGLRGEYFAGSNFEVFRSTRADAAIQFDWGTNTPIGTLPADGFSIRWQGQIEPQFTETYKFYLTHDDGARLWVNTQLVIDKWGGTATDDTGTIALTAGVRVSIKIEYFDYLSNAVCKLDWSSPSIIRENVPQTQLYAATDPILTLTATAGTGGSISPGGSVLAYSGSSRSFGIVPDTGYAVANVLADGVSQGPVTTHTFSNITANHTLAATFTTLPTYAVSGKVIAQATGNAVSGATVGFYPSVTATGSPSYTATTDASGNYTKSIPMGTWYAHGSATGFFVTPAQTVTVGAGPVTGVNFALAANTRNVPRTGDLLFSAVTDSLPASGTIASWPSYQPAGQTLSTIANPTVETIRSVKWEQNFYADGDGLTVGTAYSAPIAVNGSSMVVAIKPVRSSDSGNWRSIVDIFYDRLVLGIANNNGQIMVRRNGSFDWAPLANAIPDGQLTILSLVVQPDGTFKVWSNGTQIMSISTTSTMTSLVNGVAGTYANYVTVGRNWPDGWTTFNGNIGDVFVYKVALTDAERQQLEADVRNKFGMAAGYTVTATSGTGGSVGPAGTTVVAQGGSLACAVTPSAGYNITSVLVDGVNQGAISSYTFTNVTANHTISATFSGSGTTTYTITSSAGAGGSITPAGAVTVNSGNNQAFSITPEAGYSVAQVTVDGSDQGPVSSYTFTNVTANHSITATFTTITPTTYTITATAGSGGAITPSGAVSVNSGANQTFIISADPGYTISGVTVDGGSVGAVADYTFSGVTANHTITASFAAANTPPAISTVADQNLISNTQTAELAFTVGDDLTPAADLTVTAASSNTTLVPNANVVLGGSNTNRTVRVTPAANQTGTATITLAVSDGTLSTPSSFTVTVTTPPVGSPKAISINVGYNGTLASSDSAGMFAASHWNEISGTSNNPSSSSLVDESGAAVTGMTASFQGNGNTFNWNGVPGHTMLSGFLSGATMTASLTNIPYALYDVYVYYAGFSSNQTLTWTATDTGSATLLDTRYSVRGTKSSVQLFSESGFVQSQYSTLAAASAAASGNGGNYLKFTGLTAANLRIAETTRNGFGEIGFAGIQIVNTTPENTYGTWISGYPAVGGATGFNDDPDGDGVYNGLENYLGTNPSLPSAALTHISATASILKFRHTRGNNAATDVTAVYQWSTDLVSWFASGQTNGQGTSATIATTLISDTNAPDNDVVEATVTATAGTATRVFARIRTSRIP